MPLRARYIFFFFNDTATTEIYTLSLHDALPISFLECLSLSVPQPAGRGRMGLLQATAIHSRRRPPACPYPVTGRSRSEEHTSELQSQSNLVCRLLLEL